MRIETTAGDLRKALKLCEPFFAGCSWMPPVLSMVKLSGRRIIATDLDVQIEVSFPAIVADGEALVMFKPLRKLVNALGSDETVTLLRTDTVVEVLVGNGRYCLPSLDVADFPAMALKEELQTMELDSNAFREALRFCLPAISTEETRYYLNGVCLWGRDVVATDGHRLAVTYDVLPVAMDKVIIPRPVIQYLAKLPAIPSVSILKGDVMVFRTPGIVIHAKLIDGTYPDWTRVVPKPESAKGQVSCDIAPLRRALKRLQAVSSGMTSLALVGDGTRIAASMRDSFSADGDLQAEDHIEATGDAFEAGFNLRYANEALSALGGDVVTIKVEDSTAPFVLRSDRPENRMIVLMPLRSAEKTLAQSRTLLQRLRQDVAA